MKDYGNKYGIHLDVKLVQVDQKESEQCNISYVRMGVGKPQKSPKTPKNTRNTPQKNPSF